MSNLVQFLAKHRLTRYGLFFVSGGLVASWLVANYPQAEQWCKAFWAQPAVGLALALGGLWAGQQSKTDWEKRVKDALMTFPPIGGNEVQK